MADRIDEKAFEAAQKAAEDAADAGVKWPGRLRAGVEAYERAARRPVDDAMGRYGRDAMRGTQPTHWLPLPPVKP